jgi:competence protein ComEA
MIKELRELIVFNRKEKNGIFVLLFLIVLLIVVNLLLPFFITHQPVDTSKWEAEVENYYAQKKVGIINSEIDSFFINIHPFDPNEVPAGYLVKIGLPEKVVSNWMKYIEKGGFFKSKEMVSKIYGMTLEDYNRISEYLVFPAKETNNKLPEKMVNVNNNEPIYNKRVDEKRVNDQPMVIEQVEINSADSMELLSVPGIGPTLSSRIIKYRKMLGGYYSVEQLKEVYGLKEEHFNLALPHLSVNTDLITRFNINFSSVNEMGRHPYIGFKTAKRIVKKKDTNGRYESSEQLGLIIPSDSLIRLLPYLIFNQ